MMNSSCIADPADDKYSFYEYIDKYLEYERFCYHDKKCNKYNEKCKLIGSIFYGMEEKRANICSGFHFLIEELLKLSPLKSDIDEKYHLEFLNYWLNYELYNKDANIGPKEFHQNMKVNDPKNQLLDKLNGKLSYIDEDETNDMYWLFYLYKDYINIKNSVTGENPSENLFHSYTKHCVDKYQELEDKCLNKTTPFCKALCNFRKKYEQIDLSNEAINGWKNKILPPLSKNAKAQVNDTKLPRVLDHTSLEDTGNTARGNITPVTSSESLERGSGGPVKYGAMTETITDSEPIVEDGSHQLSANSYLAYKPQQNSLEDNKQNEIPKENDFDKHTNKIIGTSISTLGVSSLFFLFYKFTSLGSRFRSQNKGKKYIRNNFDQQSNNFLDTSEYQYTPEESMSYNISYNSV
ncbi:PIR protein [Plasmodium vivax]|uniref:VIR protein n=1 Tax=Plasmodium vivax TaxID=5855 RepID=A0A565A581_PLAVI|nr:PIR protein [Plasmodium vivax]